MEALERFLRIGGSERGWGFGSEWLVGKIWCV